jgi:hypothetical protein
MKKSCDYSASVLIQVATIYSLCLEIDTQGRFKTEYTYRGNTSALCVTVSLTAGVSEESDVVTVYDSDSTGRLYLDDSNAESKLERCVNRLEEIRNECISNAQPISLW